MVEADSHLKLLPSSIYDIYKVFEHIDMLSMGIQQQPYTVIPTLLGSEFGVLGHLCGFKMMSLCDGLRLLSYSNCFLHPCWTSTKCLITLICFLLTSLVTALNSFARTVFASDCGVLHHLWSQKMSLGHG
jgi:hypothetical protein